MALKIDWLCSILLLVVLLQCVTSLRMMPWNSDRFRTKGLPSGFPSAYPSRFPTFPRKGVGYQSFPTMMGMGTPKYVPMLGNNEKEAYSVSYSSDGRPSYNTMSVGPGMVHAPVYGGDFFGGIRRFASTNNNYMHRPYSDTPYYPQQYIDTNSASSMYYGQSIPRSKSAKYGNEGDQEITPKQIKRTIQFLKYLNQYPNYIGLKHMPSKIFKFILKTPSSLLLYLIKSVRATLPNLNTNLQTALHIMLWIQKIPLNFSGYEIKEAIGELEEFIITIAFENTYLPLSDNVIQILCNHDELARLVYDIFKEHEIDQSELNAGLMMQLLQLIKDTRTGGSQKETLLPLVDLIMKLYGARDLATKALDGPNHKLDSKMQLFLQAVERTEGKDIPADLREWLSKLPNGKKITAFLEKPGQMKCEPNGAGAVRCVKKTIKMVKQTPSPTWDSVPYDESVSADIEIPDIEKPDIEKPETEIYEVPEHIEKELVDFIYSIRNNTFVDVSPALFKFYTQEPERFWLILTIFGRNSIPDIETLPWLIYSLLELLVDFKNHAEPSHVDPTVLAMLSNLKGGKQFLNYILDWLLENKADSMMEILMEAVYGNGGHISQHLREWILSLKNGEAILEFLQLPGEIWKHY